MIFDKPRKTVQKFEVPSEGGRIVVIRTQIDRQAHNTVTDTADTIIDYDVYKKVSDKERSMAIDKVERFLEDEDGLS